jgi:CubicO group peptidase (beta-lactamase class C family)
MKSFFPSLRLSLFLVAFLAGACRGGTDPALPVSQAGSQTASQTLELPTWPQDEWQRAASPEDVGWSASKLEEARLFASKIETDALVIVDRGLIVQQWGDISTPMDVHSIRKSLLSALVGLAIEEADLTLANTLDDLGIDDEPPLSEEEKQARVVDLLTSRSGVYHRAAYESSAQEKTRPRRGAHSPGQHFYYNNWDFNALGTIVEQSLGENVSSLLDHRIARPIGMQDFSPDLTEFRRDKHSEHPAYLFKMSARDLARFGLLYLRHGTWREEQIIGHDWVQTSTETQVPNATEHRSYGYLWWTYPGLFVASGSGGQKLVVVPDKQLVIVHLARENRLGQGGVDQVDFWQLFGKIMAAKTP